MTEESLRHLNKLMALCSRSEKCESEARDYMTKRGASDEDADLAVEYLVENKYVDNRRYAGFYVADKFRFNKWGKDKIVQQLRLKKIPQDIINEALEENYSENDEKELILHELAKKLRSIKEESRQKTWEKLMRFAIGRGYSYNSVKDLIDSLLKDL